MLALSRKHSLLTALAIAIASVNVSKPTSQTQPDKLGGFLSPNQYSNEPPEPPQQPEPPKTDKNWWVRSKTVWFNVGVTALGVAAALFPIADSVMPFAKPYMSQETFALLTAIIGAGNVVLRAKTQTKLTQQANNADGTVKPNDDPANDTNPTQDE